MSNRKKQRLSMLDNLGQAGVLTPIPAVQNRALRAAQDAVDGHRIWELDPEQIADLRMKDRLNDKDVEDLRLSIETVGQTVPILVRRDPDDPDRFLLVYGRRRLEAIRSSSRVNTVRALIASMDDRAALAAQISENTARRDLSFIERALFALELAEGGFGTQTEIAEMLNATKSTISMSVTIVQAIGKDLVRAIGPAHGVGRPRWKDLAQDIAAGIAPVDELIDTALQAHAAADEGIDPSVAAFDAVARHLRKASATPAQQRSASRAVSLHGKPAGRAIRTESGWRLDLRITEPEFADWLHEQADTALEDLYRRWKDATGS